MGAPPGLEALVRHYLWPQTPEQFRQAQARLRAGENLGRVSRARFEELEAILRRGAPLPHRVMPSGGLEEWSLKTGEGTIPVLAALPPGYSTDRRWPLMLAMHGGPPRTREQALAGARRMIRAWREAAGKAGWVVVSPAMLTSVSVDRYTRQRLPYQVFHPEEMAAVIEAARRRYRIDPDRVVSTGISLGSNYSIALAASRPDLLAAIVPVSTEGESREKLLANLLHVPVYILEGSGDRNIRTISGPRAMEKILRRLGYDILYREFAGHQHEGFEERYGDVLRWLARRARNPYPHRLLRVPHAGIMPLSRRLYWIESDTRQGALEARVVSPGRIEIRTARLRRLNVFLEDRLTDLEQPLEVWINGVRVFQGRVERSIPLALQEIRRRRDEGLVYAAVLRLEVPRTEAALERSRAFLASLRPLHPAGTLSFWETYAVRALRERFPRLGFSAREEEPPPGLEMAPGARVLAVETVDPGSAFAAAGLRAGDRLIEVGGEPFYPPGPENLYSWLLRELRPKAVSYPLKIWRKGRVETLEARLRLGPYRHTSAPPAPTRSRPLITFDHYHRLPEIERFLERLTERYARLARLVEIGRSRAGRRILALEVNNPETGPAREKPGFYLDGNIHGGEVLGGEGALFFLDDLLGRYGRDAGVTRLVDTLAFYVVPIVNPDGRAISVSTPENHRWNLRPTDEDGDGRVDEDPPEDLDGDGRILQMRLPDAAGRWKVSPRDARLMVRRRPGETGGHYYSLYREGIDNDGDGRYNEDGLGGVDVNRNFPANWYPAQYASGPYPLSEPESRALVEYITSHPNIAVIHTYHTSGGLLLRFPTLADQEWDYPQEDLEDYRQIAEEGARLTGYLNFAYQKKKIVDLMHPGHGVFNDWGSKIFGVLAMTTEMWKHPMTDPKALLDWNDTRLGGRGFIAWHPFHHPQLGEVELGGWDRWSIASPPEPMIRAELVKNQAWVLSLAGRLPRVRILEGSARKLSGKGVWEVRATVANVGWLPTATAYAEKVLKTARPVLARIRLENARLLAGPAKDSLGVLPGAHGGEPHAVPLRWQVRVLDSSRPAWAEIVVVSEKGGTDRRRVELGRIDQAHSSAPLNPGEGRAHLKQ